MPDLHPHSPTAHRKPTDLFGDPIDSHPQWFKQSSFLDPNFDPESYISDLRTFVPFETLRSELRSHLASLKHELVELINRDYADFVNLSTKLVDVDASVVRMRAPLNELREKIVVFRAAVEDSLVKLRNGLQQRADAQAAREVLEVLLDTFHVVSKENHYFTMAVTFYNLSSEAGIKKLDEYLLSRSYISGYQASKDDLAVHVALAKPPLSNYVNVSRWYNHIEALLRISGVSADGCGVTVEGSSVATPPVADTKASAAEDDDDDDVDLFGEETEEEKKAAEERAAAVKASGKKKESGKSSVLLDVKPWDDETDMTKLEEAVRSIKKEGLLWGACPVAHSS